MLNTRQFSKEEKLKRHHIFRKFIALVRGEHFYSVNKKLMEFSETNFCLPILNTSKNFSLLSQNEIFQLRVCTVPQRILNHLVCMELAKIFGDLSHCGCFFKKTWLDEETSQIHIAWLLDIDKKNSGAD